MAEFRTNTPYSEILKADSDNGEQAEKTAKAGNTGLPFGLCKKYGISLPENATPRQAWDVLKGKTGMTPSDFYDELKDTEDRQRMDQLKGNGSKQGGTFKRAASRTEADEQTAKWSEIVSFSPDVSFDKINLVNEAMHEAFEKYPLLKKLHYVRTNSRFRRANAQACGSILEIKTAFLKQDHIAVDWQKRTQSYPEKIKAMQARIDSGRYPRDMVANFRKTINDYQTEMKFGRWTVSSSIQGDAGVKAAIIHEMGHTLADQYFGQINLRLQADGRAQKAGTRRMVEDVFFKAKKNGDIYKISQYASQDKYEFFAECFCLSVIGEGLPSYIQEMIDGALKK